MEEQKSLWPLLVILLLSLLIAAFFWWPRTAHAPQPSDDIGSGKEAPRKTAEKTTSSQPVSTSSAGKRVFENGAYVTIVEYTKTGFIPSSLTINVGEEVRFVNYSGGTMRVGTDALNSSLAYKEYKQSNTVGAGGVFQVALVTPGTWMYQNLNTQPPTTGVITIIEKK